MNDAANAYLEADCALRALRVKLRGTNYNGTYAAMLHRAIERRERAKALYDRMINYG